MNIYDPLVRQRLLSEAEVLVSLGIQQRGGACIAQVLYTVSAHRPSSVGLLNLGIFG